MAPRKTRRRALVALALATLSLSAQPLRLHPTNPHYFEYQGQPTVLITSGEHYGAVLNLDFDFDKYLATLAADGLNYTRVFAGAYSEVPGSFNIERNTLAPAEGRYLSAFDDAFLTRLQTFVRAAARRGIIVEVTLFCTFYEDVLWQRSPLNIKPGVPRNEALALKHPEFTTLQEQHVRRIVRALKDEPNVFYEICNEPYFQGVTLEWQRHIAALIAAEDKQLKHLIAQNIANHHQRVAQPDPNVQLLNFHYARPPVTIAENWHLNRPLGCDETGFDGFDDAIYRLQGWDFILSGGALYNNLDYSFAVGHETGDYHYPGTTPGGGSAKLRTQLGHLRRFVNEFDFVKMQPTQAIVAPDASVAALAEPGHQYAIYLHQGRLLPDSRPRYIVGTAEKRTPLEIAAPAGRYQVKWLDPKTGSVIKEESAITTGPVLHLASPPWREDLAVAIRLAR